MSINKRNIDHGEISPESPGPIRPSGTATHARHRREAERAAENTQLRGVSARKAGPQPPAGTPDDLCVRDADQPMSDDQAEHLRILCEEAGEPFDPSLTRDGYRRRRNRLEISRRDRHSGDG